MSGSMERRQKNLVFRTWTVGAYPVGDLQWNRRTFDRVFGGITSDRLVISMKVLLRERCSLRRGPKTA